MARPTLFTQEYADSICEHIVAGKSLVTWCKEEDRPSFRSVMRWLESDKEFRHNYARAREAQADFLAEEIIQISDDGQNDSYTDEDGNERTNHDVIARSRLRVDARKWYAAKLAPKKYGEKTETVLTGPNGGPIQSESRVNVSGLSIEHLRALASIPVQSD